MTSLHGLFSGRGGTALRRGDLIVEAVVLDKEEAHLLNTSEGFPAFRIEHVFFDFDEKPVSWGKFICRGDRLRFTTSVGIT
jgi:DNA-binding GntR family transcriptional regulator